MPPRGGVHALPAQHLGGDALPQVNHYKLFSSINITPWPFPGWLGWLDKLGSSRWHKKSFCFTNWWNWFIPTSHPGPPSDDPGKCGHRNHHHLHVRTQTYNLTHVLPALTFYLDPPPQSLSIQQFPFPDSKSNISFPLLPQVSNLYKRANQFRRSLLHDLKVVTDNADELLYPMPIVNCCQLCVIIPGLLGRSLEEPSAWCSPSPTPLQFPCLSSYKDHDIMWYHWYPAFLL